jgi:hypothetical protein
MRKFRKDSKWWAAILGGGGGQNQFQELYSTVDILIKCEQVRIVCFQSDKTCTEQGCFEAICISTQFTQKKSQKDLRISIYNLNVL